MHQIRLLGPVELVGPEGSIVLGGTKQRSVLAMLALSANNVVSTDRLIAGLWGDTAPDTALSAIQGHISRLRAILRVKVETDTTLEYVAPGYRLGIDPNRVDALRFEHDVDEALTQRPDSLADRLTTALGLWRGDALGGVADAPFAATEIVRLEELRLNAVEARASALLDQGKHLQVVADLIAPCEQHPFREQLCGLLAVALYRSGQQAEALRVIDSVRLALRDDLGLDLSAELRVLETQILQHDPVLNPVPTSERHEIVTVRPSRPAPPPSQLDQMFGRDEDIDRLKIMLNPEHGVRLVTLLGTGGIGKTRLAVALIHELVDIYDGNTWFVPLADVETAAEVPSYICAALRLADSGQEPEQRLAAFFSLRPGLLVLDNYEHVTDAAPLLEHLLTAAPTLHVVTTSRRRLGIAGEQSYRVDPLGCDGNVDSPAVQMFIARARSLDARFTADVGDIETIQRICTRFDGVPLAIELVAARTGLVGLRELDEMIADQSAAGRALSGPVTSTGFSRLATSLIATIGDLNATERLLLSRLSIFRGGASLRSAIAATAIDDTIALDPVEVLLDRSLIHPRDGSRGERRFDLLETVRSVVAELSSERDRRANAEWHAAHIAELLAPNLTYGIGPQRSEDWISQSAEWSNIQSAISWADTHNTALFARLVVGAAYIYEHGGHRQEMSAWLDRVLASDLEPALRVQALIQRSWTASELGPLSLDVNPANEARRLAAEIGDDVLLIGALAGVHIEQFGAGGGSAGLPILDEMDKLLETLEPGHPLRAYHPFNDLFRHISVGDLDAAYISTKKTVEGAVRSKTLRTEVVALNNLCEAALRVGQIDEALRAARRGMELTAEHSFDVNHAVFLSFYGTSLLHHGHPHDAVKVLSDGFDLLVRHAAGSYIVAETLVRLSAAHLALGNGRIAALLRGVAIGLVEQHSFVDDAARSEYVDDLDEALPASTHVVNADGIAEGRELVTRRGSAEATQEVLRWRENDWSLAVSAD